MNEIKLYLLYILHELGGHIGSMVARRTKGLWFDPRSNYTTFFLNMCKRQSNLTSKNSKNLRNIYIQQANTMYRCTFFLSQYTLLTKPYQLKTLPKQEIVVNIIYCFTKKRESGCSTQDVTCPSGKLPFDCQKIAKTLNFCLNCQKLAF